MYLVYYIYPLFIYPLKYLHVVHRVGVDDLCPRDVE